MGASELLWITIISCFAMWTFVQIVSKIVDGVVRTKQSRLEMERDYLVQMVADLEEIKARLEDDKARV